VVCKQWYSLKTTHYGTTEKEKIKIVLEGLRGEDSIAAICRKYDIHQNSYFTWSKDFMEAGKRRLSGDTAREEFHDKFSKFIRLVCIGKYTGDLCITLYIVSNGKPIDDATVAFLTWVLREGQQIIEENGYARLPGFT
jgi:ABC-type phosphate transport system substrate-binding protein